MVSSIGVSNVNQVNMLNALNAFKSVQEVKPETSMPEVSDGIDIQGNEMLQNIDLNEIKQYAKIAGEENISEDDIKYGMTYGRSVIAEYIA